MSADLQRDLFLAILALDAYNRSYDAPINGLASKWNESKIGNAVIKQYDATLTAQDAGFFAIAYDVSNVAGFGDRETVISYRGTDANLPTVHYMGGSDLVNGYTIALGDTTAPQGLLAAKFYKDVTDKGEFEFAPKVTLTGHSLGGGLAGLVSATSGTEAVLFDHMPFGVAAMARRILGGQDEALAGTPSAYHTEGEFLGAVRGGASGALGLLFLGSPVAVVAVETVAEATRAHEATLDNETVAPGAFLYPLASHSMALLVTLLWAKANGADMSWLNAAEPLWSAYFDADVAGAIPQALARTVANLGTPLGTMQNAIAYSAISEGERPFGDTGIKALFNDAADLGRVIGKSVLDADFGAYASDIARSFVQFAGSLALNAVMVGEAATGMLAASDSVLRLDYSDALWTQYGMAAPANILGQAALFNAVFAAQDIASATVSQIGVRFGDAAGEGVVDAFDYLMLGLDGNGGAFAIDRGASDKAAVFVGKGGSDTVYGSSDKDLLLGNDGRDALYGIDGNDILVGGEGDDTLDGGMGDDVLDGGEGDDSYYWVYSDAGDSIIDSGGTDTLTIDLAWLGIYRSEVLLMGNSIDIRGTSLTIDGDIEQINIINAQDDIDIPVYEYLYGRLDEYYNDVRGEWIYNDDFNDRIYTSTGVVSVVYGRDGNDWMQGTDVEDELYGEAGNDTLTGTGHLSGDDGDDRIDAEGGEAVGGWGDDTITMNWGYVYGGAGDDKIDAEGGQIFGGDGDDRITNSWGNVSGGDGNDTITNSWGSIDGGAGRDSLSGGDTVRGGDGDDTITVNGMGDGGAGEDYLSGVGLFYGGAGNDTIMGAGLLYGEDGDDLIIAQDFGNEFTGGKGNDTLYGGAESDRFRLNFDAAASGVDSIVAGDGADWAAIGAGDWYFDGGAGNDTISFFYVTGEDGVTVDLNASGAQATGIGRQTLISVEAAQGTSFGDVIKGNAGANTLWGGDGGDLIYNGANADGVLDYIYGGSGDDTIAYEGGLVTMSGGDGNDTMEIRVAGDSYWYFSADIENFIGNTGNDSITFSYASDNDFHFRGGEGNDTFNGNEGDDTLDGEAGDDLLFGSFGNDTLDGGAGFDSVSYYYAPGAINADLATGIVKDGFGTTDRLISIERLYAGGGNDRVTGSAGNDIIVGNAGDDTLTTGLGGQDELHGGAGNDTYIYESNAPLTIFEGAGGGIDTFEVRIATASYWTLNYVERFIGGTGNDEVAVSSDVDAGTTLLGMDGNDTLTGSRLGDSLAGGNGNDIVRVSEGADILDGGAGRDLVTYLGWNWAVDLDLVAGRAVKSNGETDTLSGFESVHGSMLNDTLAGSSSFDVLVGNDGDDIILGRYGDDLVIGGEGDDSLQGGDGHDTLEGEAGRDTLSGGTGSDLLDGGTGDDALYGGVRWDTLKGGDGDDTLDGGDGNDAMYGGAGDDVYIVDHVGDRVYESRGEGNDTVRASITYSLTPNVEVLQLTGLAGIGGTGNGLSNALHGNSGGNVLSGGSGNDSLYGWDGDDWLAGGNDHDRLSGGNGSDTLTGGHGNDQIGGGAGADDFVFSSVAVNGHDHIVDFQHGIDRLVFIAADYGFADGHVLTAAEFTEGRAAIGLGAQFVWDSAAGKLWWDADGAGAGEAFELALISNVSVVTKDDLYIL